MLLLVQFLYRLSFGMAAAMVVTSPRKVTSGYYRNNCYVLLGLNVLAALAARAGATDERGLPWQPAAAAAVIAYVAAVMWLYEKPQAGVVQLAVVAAFTLLGTLDSAVPIGATMSSSADGWLWLVDAAASGLLLGVTMAAMLLGHWYLNAPGMQIAPLQKLNALIGVAVLLRTVVCAIGLVHYCGLPTHEFAQSLMLGLRWLAGLGGTAGLVVMTWSTLKIPNTQAATGMLYVAVITTFLGELLGQLLSVSIGYPL
jgi:hypothetical protein